MNEVEKRSDGLYETSSGQKVGGLPVDVNELIETLRKMEGSTTARIAADTLARFRRLLLPVWMGIMEQTMVGEAHPDNARIFNFMGSGGSDFTFLGEFRALMGDDRVIHEKSMCEYEEAMAAEEKAAISGECTNLSGCQRWSEHEGACGYSRANFLSDAAKARGEIEIPYEDPFSAVGDIKE